MRPVRNKDIWASPLAAVVATSIGAFYDGISTSAPSLDVSRSASALEKALADGSVVYRQGKFTGKFTAAISKELKTMGATFQSTFSGWSIPITLVPNKISNLAYKAQELKGRWISVLQAEVKKAVTSPIAAAVLPLIYLGLVSKVSKEIEQTTERAVPIVQKDPAPFTMSIQEAIKGFTDSEQKVINGLLDKATKEDWEISKLESALMGRVGIGKDRAKFIAKQGMAIAATDLKAKIYPEIGLPKYRWQTQRDGRVRSDHAILDGEIFDWSNPPLVNSSTGMHAHPGQDWRCRCAAVPVEG